MNDLFDPMCLEGCSKLARQELFSAAADSPMILYAIGVVGAALTAKWLVKILF